MRLMRSTRILGPELEAAEEVGIRLAAGFDFRLGGVGDGWGDAGEVVEGVVVFGLGEAADCESDGACGVAKERTCNPTCASWDA